MNKTIWLMGAMALGFLSGCNEDVTRKIVRTKSTGSSVSINEAIPLGHQECDKSVENRCYDSHDECKEVCVHGECEKQCEWIPYHCKDEVVTTCHFVKERDFLVKAKLQFDPRAKLTGDQQEKYKLTGTYNKDNTVNVQVDVDSDYYSYDYVKEFVLKDGESRTIRFTANRK